MKSTKLSHDELNRRCDEVFWLREDDDICNVRCKDDYSFVDIIIVSKKDHEITDYRPNMTERPEALRYILGEIDQFSD